MPSIIEGYSYDIFISYRQKDNKHDGWVTEFVNNLKGELESTFKEEISVYFDINPHDGLLETHDVDASLKEKLRCLVFIPIISQTYCDSKSFAWEHEFVAFNKMAKEDRFGRDIKLTGGNVTSRILPVKVHDLDPEDKALLENELGGVLRCIEFIYKSAGVNRPLRAVEDHPQDNLSKTYYRDQINKVANAIKEIIVAVKKHNQQDGEVPKDVIKTKSQKPKNLKPKIILISFLVLALILIGYFFIPKVFKSSKPIEKSIAILPFINDSPDQENTYFINGVVGEILTNLQRIKDIRIIPRTSTEQYRNQTKSISVIASELGVNYVVEGSGQKYGNTIRLKVKLIIAAEERYLWEKSYEEDIKYAKDIFRMQTQIAQAIALELQAAITPQEKQLINNSLTENLEAYNYYLRGNEYFWQSSVRESLKTAIEMYEKAIKLDPAFALAYTKLSICHSRIYFFPDGHSNERLIKIKAAIDSALKIDPDLPETHLALGAFYYNTALDYPKALEQIDIAEQLLPNNSECSYWKANIYRRSGSWELAKEHHVKAYKLDPGSAVLATAAGQTLSRMGEYPEAEHYLNKSISINPLNFEPYYELWWMYIKWNGNTLKAREILEKASTSLGPGNKLPIQVLKVQTEIYNTNYQKALEYLSDLEIDSVAGVGNVFPPSLNYAIVYKLVNQPQKAYSYFDSARIFLEARILKIPDNSTLYGDLGIAYAGLGQKKKAIEAGKKAVEMVPITKDASSGPSRIEFLAKIYVMTGEYDAALELIKPLLSIPAGLTGQILLLDPVWKPLWNLSDFKKLINTSDLDAKHN